MFVEEYIQHLNPECVIETKNLDAIFVGDSELSFLEFFKKSRK